MEELKEKSGIYAIVNLKNGHTYIGQAVDLEKRRKQHFYELDRNEHFNQYLQNAYNLHGKPFFSFTIIEFLVDPSPKMLKKLLDDREQYWINKNNPEYNMTIFVGEELAWEQVKMVGNNNDVIILRHWQKFKPPDWYKWVYGGEKNPLVNGRKMGHKDE